MNPSARLQVSAYVQEHRGREGLSEFDGERSRLSAGESIHVPRGVIHSSANVGEQSGRRVVLFSPAGMERFFQEAGVLAADSDIDLGAALASAVSHGWEFIADP
jgi:hypothetical protein